MKSLSTIIALVTMTMLSFNFVGAQQLPNLKVSQIATPGGIKVGNCNKVKVTIVNNQQVAAEDIQVKLVVSQSGVVTTSYKTLDAIGPNDNNGQAVWFHDVNYALGGSIQLIAHVNEDLNVHETSYSDNDKIKTIGAPSSSSACPGNSSNSTAIAKADLKIQVVKKTGSLTVSNTRPTPLSRAVVELRTSSGKLVGKKTSDSKGYVLFENVPSNKSYKITAKRSGCSSYVNKYKMANKNSKLEIPMSCKN